MSLKTKSVTTIGGGTGSPLTNEALFLTNKVDTIQAITAMYDSGGATGRDRLGSHGQKLAYSDAMRNALSLVPPTEYDTPQYRGAKELFNHRDPKNGTVLGQAIMHAYFDKINGFSKLENMLDSFGIKLRGHVLPSATEPSDIAFETQWGRKHVGEHLLDEFRMSEDKVINMSLTPNVEAFAPAMKAIEHASFIFLSCGSIHGSVLSNFLPKGMKEALLKSTAKMILVTNLVSNRNETHGFTPIDFVNLVKKYSGKNPDTLIVPAMTREEFERKFPTVAKSYEDEHAYFLGWNNKELQEAEKQGIQILKHQATVVVEGKDGFPVVRHDPIKLSRALALVLPQRKNEL